MRFSPPYSAYARIYDRIGQRVFGERMATVVLNELAHRKIVPRSVLDLGCGTGSATLAFAEAGIEAVGVDRSPEMLALARDVAVLAGFPAAFVEADMTNLALGRRFDLITCVYDAVNYLDDDLAVTRFLQVAARHLVHGGVFVFDMNTLSRLSSSWEQGLVLVADDDDLYVTYRSWFDPAIDSSPLIVTAFLRDEAGDWHRFDEEHIERSWPIDRMRSWLRDAGFHVDDVVGYVDATGEIQRPAREEHGRVVFIASR